MSDELTGPKPHLIFEREPNTALERRRRRNAMGPSMPERNRSEHGRRIQTEINSVRKSIGSNRNDIGVDPKRLLVVGLKHWNENSRKELEARFNAKVVDEQVRRKPEKDEPPITLLVQFETDDDFQKFEKEASLYSDESSRTEAMPVGKRQQFFDGFETCRNVSPEERRGSRLSEFGWPETKDFEIDVDLWHPGGRAVAREVLETLKAVCLAHGGEVSDSMITSTLLLARVKSNRTLAEALLLLDIVARVDLPPILQLERSDFFQELKPITEAQAPKGDEPRVGVLDSGVISGHPLLLNWIYDASDFRPGLSNPEDEQGHGTSVAGLVAYGDLVEPIKTGVWQPQVIVCSAKVLTKISPYDVVFPDGVRPEALVEKVIQSLHKDYGCRVFNLSLGDSQNVYKGQRQFAWAEVLDKLARELDIVLVVSAGNYSEVEVPDPLPTLRPQIQEALRDSMLEEVDQRLCNPATASIAITVGAIARTEIAMDQETFGASPAGAPAVYSRLGPGYEAHMGGKDEKMPRRTVKPDFVDFGGNFGLDQNFPDRTRWRTKDLMLGEPVLKRDFTGGRFINSNVGTSFAAPRVANLAGRTLEEAKKLLGRDVSANLVRSLLGLSAETPPCGKAWLLDPEGKETWEKLRLVGYGKINSDHALASSLNSVSLLAEDEIDLEGLHVYRIEIPPSFVSGKGKRGLSVSLAFDPPVRSSRKEYLSNTLKIEILKGLTTSEIGALKARQESADAELPLPASKKLDLVPSASRVMWSTLQVRHKVWSRVPKFPVNENDNQVIHLLVTSQSRFEAGTTKQGYALSAKFWHSDAQIDLYSEIKTRIRARQVQRIRPDLRA